jgi:TonB family protein
MLKKILLTACLTIASLSAFAQSSNHAKFAEELLLWSQNTMKESLPMDYGIMILDDIIVTDKAVNYIYRIKDNTVYESYKASQQELKQTLRASLQQSITSMASSIVFLLDSGKEMQYHYTNALGKRFAVTFTQPELYELLGRKTIDPEFRESVVSSTIQLTMATLPAEENFQMAYGGIKDNCIVYNIYTDGVWADGYQVDLKEIVTSDFTEKTPSIFFHLVPLYLSKGEIYTVEDRESHNKCSDKLSATQLRTVYDLASSVKAARQVPPPPVPGQYSDEDEDEFVPFPYQLVEEKPLFQGGNANEFSKWVNQRLVYPEDCKGKVQGRVTLTFLVDVDGSVKNVKVLRGPHPSLEKEAVRVVSSSPKWTPGRQNGEAVPVTYTFPVIFQSF